MNPVEYHLKLIIYLWSGATAQQYSIDSQLRDIWNAHVPGLLYESVGISQFMHKMYQDPVFGPCPAAHDMTPGEFLTGGDLQTVKAVYVRLQGCGTLPGAVVASDLTQSWAAEPQQKLAGKKKGGKKS